LQIRPNANQLFGSGLDNLFYYAEAYQLEGIANDQNEYTLLTYVSEANRPQPVGTLEKRDTRTARNPDVLVGSFDLSELPSGSYFLRMALLNADNEAVAEQARKFFVYNPSVERDQPLALENSFETSEYASMTEEEVARSVEHINIIASETEKRRIRRIEDLNEKRRFLMEFWGKRDPTPGQHVNGFKEEFYQRLQYANDRYSNNRSEGWKTDRGRTILKYGMPSAVEPHLYDRDMEPYELWQYNNIPGEGQAIFVFADRNGFGEFELLHSTVSGEPKLPNWQQELRQL
jgi:GWxTD domain-containing protein